MKFEKPSTSIPDQIELLRRRGMLIEDQGRAEHYLQFISYYRLRAYWLAFEVPAAEDGDHAFREGTTFENVLGLYVFDRQLRLLMLDAIERVEVAIRAQWAHHMAMTHGPHGYLDQHLYKRRDRHGQAVSRLTDEFTYSRDTFAEHYREKYSSPTLPPIWMTAEIISFGQLSKWLYNLKRRADRNAIARPFGLDERILCSVAHHVSYVRNICAHHGRLWNKRFTVTMQVPVKPAALGKALEEADERRLHNTIVMLDHMLSLTAPESGWLGRVRALIEATPLAWPSAMGFPDGWQERDVWRVAV
ncbi:Abi family protein [Jannaschia rubra]|uniref:Abortive infection bacteriophage resistance protein n=1 Tax=Jannaschia rubra TaxID=282197 RepID=A0A0M6XUM7_9RHOB|nr:Abi family protein [Jannaschia rubra]CTQ33931.1 Abortive infection bacteriophage resistance protein [Jannaschia rubra]SFG76432.1 Abortive infection bacteriophage resistance protein [Jannaschia rubra]